MLIFRGVPSFSHLRPLSCADSSCEFFDQVAYVGQCVSGGKNSVFGLKGSWFLLRKLRNKWIFGHLFFGGFCPIMRHTYILDVAPSQ